MTKETFYFSHDYNAIQDPKMMALLNCSGLSGVGMYWILIEILHQQPNKKILYKSFEDYIEFYGRIDGNNEQVLNKLKEVFITIGLFVEDGEYIFSKRVLENQKQRELLSDKRSFAGKKSAEIRQKGTSVKQNLTSVEQDINKGQQGKERKGKERKGNNIIEREQQVAPPSSEVRLFFLDVDKQEEILNHLKGKGIEENVCRREIAKFISYWTEPNKSGTKQRWELEQTFEISRRLTTWFSRMGTFNKTFQKDNLSKVIKI